MFLFLFIKERKSEIIILFYIKLSGDAQLHTTTVFIIKTQNYVRLVLCVRPDHEVMPDL